MTKKTRQKQKLYRYTNTMIFQIFHLFEFPTTYSTNQILVKIKRSNLNYVQ